MKAFDSYWMVFLAGKGVVRKKVSNKLTLEIDSEQTRIFHISAPPTGVSVSGVYYDDDDCHYYFVSHEFVDKLDTWKVVGEPIFYSVAPEAAVELLAENLAHRGLRRIFANISFKDLL